MPVNQTTFVVKGMMFHLTGSSMSTYDLMQTLLLTVAFRFKPSYVPFMIQRDRVVQVPKLNEILKT